MPDNAPIGFLDSGVGGVSVLNAIRRAMPHEDFILYGDSANAPYGTKPEEVVQRLVLNAARRLMSEGIKALVIACNTATGIAGQMLKELLPIPVVGILPAVEPAQQLRRKGEILVMATPNTIRSSAMQNLLALHGENVIPLGCPGLMEFVERGELDGPALHDHLEGLLSPYLEREIDVVALGCTHFPFLKTAIARFFPADTAFIDGSARTLQDLMAALWEKDLLTAKKEPGTTAFRTSGGQETLRLMEMLSRQG